MSELDQLKNWKADEQASLSRDHRYYVGLDEVRAAQRGENEGRTVPPASPPAPRPVREPRPVQPRAPREKLGAGSRALSPEQRQSILASDLRTCELAAQMGVRANLVSAVRRAAGIETRLQREEPSN